MKAGTCPFGIRAVRDVLADDFHDELAAAVNCVDRIQNRLPVWIEVDMHVAVPGTGQGGDATVNGGAGFHDVKPLPFVDVIPKAIVTICGGQFDRRPPGVPNLRRYKKRDERDNRGEEGDGRDLYAAASYSRIPSMVLHVGSSDGQTLALRAGKRLASPTLPNWNEILRWLRELEALRREAA